MAKRALSPWDHPDFAPTRQFIAEIPELYQGALRAKSYSYRDVRVKMGLLALQPESNRSEKIYSGNVKSRQSKEKICAEKVGLTEAEDLGFTRAGGFVVVSNVETPEKIHEILKFPFKTLLFCGDCNGRTIPGSPLTSPDSLVVTAWMSKPQWQVHTVQEIQEIHDRGADVIDSPLRYGFNNWDKRVDFFIQLATDEVQKRLSAQRSMASLAITALNADVLAA
jgi:hypothetical protein